MATRTRSWKSNVFTTDQDLSFEEELAIMPEDLPLLRQQRTITAQLPELIKDKLIELIRLCEMRHKSGGHKAYNVSVGRSAAALKLIMRQYEPYYSMGGDELNEEMVALIANEGVVLDSGVIDQIMGIG